jgi:putative ABC transport system permease protein
MPKLTQGNLPGYLATGPGKLVVNWFRLVPTMLVQAFSMTALLLALLYVQHLLNLESGLPHHNRIVAFETLLKNNDGTTEEFAVSPPLLVNKLQNEIPNIIHATSVLQSEAYLQITGGNIIAQASLVDENFFKVFQLPDFENGSPKLKRDEIFVTRTFSKKHELSVGQKVNISINGSKETVSIARIVSDAPYPSQFEWDIFMPFSKERSGLDEKQLQFWGTLQFKTYALLDSTALPKPIEQVSKYDEQNKPLNTFIFSAIPIADLIFNSKAEKESTSGLENGRRLLFTSFIPMIVIISLLSVLAYVNVTAAQIANRAPEVSLRKLYGATPGQIARGFFLETGVVMLLGGLLALCLALVLLPSFNATLDMELKPQFMSPTGMLACLLAIICVQTILASLYTGWKLSAVSVDVAVRNAPALSARRSSRISQFIVTLQFIVGVTCVSLALVCAGQLYFERSYDMGYDNRHTMVIAAVDQPDYLQSKQYFEEHVASIPHVNAFGYANYTGVSDDLNTANIARDRSESSISAQRIAVDPGYFDALGIQRIAGDLSRYTVWQDEHKPLTISRATAHALGYASPAAAIGQTIVILNKKKGPQPSTIVAVVEDARLSNLRTPIGPVIYTHQPDKFGYLVASVAPGRLKETSVWMHNIWSDLIPNMPIKLTSYEEMTNNGQRQDFLFRDLTTGLAWLFTLTSLIAFWGLAMDTTSRRKLEYTLHYLYGAKPGELFRQMAKALSSWPFIGMMIGLAIGLYLGRLWLNAFDVRTAMPTPEIIFSLLGIASALLFTIAFNVHGLLKANIATTLKYE